MTKARTKAARRRRITMPGGASVPQPATQGRRTDLRREPPADAVALAARARLTGCTVEEARDVMASEDVGRCIRALCPTPEERRDLLGIWQGISAAWANYAARCLSITPTPQSAALPMLPEPMQTDQSLRIDPRTADEKDAAARRVWDEWRTAFNRLPIAQAIAIASASRGDGPTLWHPGARAATRHGVTVVHALAALHTARAA